MGEPEERRDGRNGSEDAPSAGAIVRLERPLPPADASPAPAEAQPQAPLGTPVFALPPAAFRLPPATGLLAVTFGIAGLVKVPILFGPLALLFALAAGLQRQFWYAAVGGALGAAALLTSATFWILAGFGWLATYLF
ncbi:MAG: hypothetical protein ACOY3L_05210 [Pseudomonadota bacterium]